MKMSGISLSENDKWLIGLSVVMPPLAMYLKFGRSKTLTTNCLLTVCLLLPGIFHAINSIFSYPSVVFRGRSEPKNTSGSRDDGVIWGIPQDQFQSISHSIRVLEAQNIALKSSPVRVKSVSELSLASGTRSQLTMTTSSTANESYMAYLHGQAPLLNPSYGWGPAAMGQLPLKVGITH
ncbi:hypothetical protein LPJ66_002965 [Kickxella alabastrina]|uniref:Uncharacterized protein n=1 Tax=Kickxella alabastrina TaxID=61397 RepID=A0ACC1ILY0_9FUNG|nr:hypothetical protein LPJ66_002965 [Kickxella alabastrina]